MGKNIRRAFLTNFCRAAVKLTLELFFAIIELVVIPDLSKVDTVLIRDEPVDEPQKFSMKLLIIFFEYISLPLIENLMIKKNLVYLSRDAEYFLQRRNFEHCLNIIIYF